MTVGMFTLTGELDGYGGTAATGYIVVSSTPTLIKDSAANRSFVSPKRVWLKDGKFKVSLPSDSAAGLSTAIRYRVTSRLRNGLADVDLSFWAGQIGSTVDLADPTEVPVVAPTNNAVPYSVPFSV